MIATEHADRLEERYAPSYIETAKHLFDDGSMSAVSDILQEREVISIHDVREGGNFCRTVGNGSRKERWSFC